MTTLYDIPAELLNPALAARLAAEKAVETPDWAEFVKTGVSRERPPSQENWWFLRSAALMRKLAREGPIGVTQLSQAYGGRKDNGAALTHQASHHATSSAQRFNNLKHRDSSKKCQHEPLTLKKDRFNSTPDDASPLLDRR